MNPPATPPARTLDTSLAPLPRTGGSRLIYLDVVRGLGLLLVLGRHPPMDGVPPGAWGESGFLLYSRIALVSLDVFFVLSGFLIGGMLFSEVRKTGELNVKKFLVRRAFKILPAYLLYLGVAVFAYILFKFSARLLPFLRRLMPLVL